MYAEERQQAMAQLIGQEGRLSVADLAGNFSVTTETVRRDLSALERIGLVRRVHGGAVPASSLSVIESGLGERDQANISAKDAIAAAALNELPPPGSTIVIDAGSTTARLAAVLPRDHRLNVVTHAVPVAARLAGQAQIELHLSASEQELTVLGDPDLRARQRTPHGPDLVGVREVDGQGRSGLGEAVALEHGEADPAEEVAEAIAQGSATGDRVGAPATEGVAEPAVDEPGERRVAGAQSQGGPGAALHHLRPGDGRLGRAVEELAPTVGRRPL